MFLACSKGNATAQVETPRGRGGGIPNTGDRFGNLTFIKISHTFLQEVGMSLTKLKLFTRKSVTALLAVAGVLLMTGGAWAAVNYANPTATYAVSGSLTVGQEAEVTVTFAVVAGTNGETGNLLTLSGSVPTITAAVGSATQSSWTYKDNSATATTVTYTVTPDVSGTLNLTVGSLSITITSPTRLDKNDTWGSFTCTDGGTASGNFDAWDTDHCPVKNDATASVTPTLTGNALTVGGSSPPAFTSIGVLGTDAAGAAAQIQASPATIYTTQFVSFPVKTANVKDGNYVITVGSLPAGLTVGNVDNRLRIVNNSGTLILNIANTANLTTVNGASMTLTLADVVGTNGSTANLGPSSTPFKVKIDKATLTAAHLTAVWNDTLVKALDGSAVPAYLLSGGSKGTTGTDIGLGTVFGASSVMGSLTPNYHAIVNGVVSATATTLTDAGPVGIYAVIASAAEGTNFAALANAANGAVTGIRVATLVVRAQTNYVVLAVDSVKCASLTGVYGNRNSSVNLSGCQAWGKDDAQYVGTTNGTKSITGRGWFSATNPAGFLKPSIVGSSGTAQVSVTFTSFAKAGAGDGVFVKGDQNQDVVVSKADIKSDFSNLDTTKARRWLDSLSAAGGFRATGSAVTVPSAAIVVPNSELSGLGDATYSFRDMTNAVVASARTKGTYSLWVSFAAGTNYNATPSPIKVGDFSIKYDDFRGKLNLASGTATFSVSGSTVGYAFKMPELNSGVVGRVDSISTIAGERLSAIFYPSGRNIGTSKTLTLGDDLLYRASDMSFVVKVDEVGRVDFKYVAVGTTTASGTGNIWEASTQWQAFIVRKEITAADVYVKTGVGDSLFYTGADLTQPVLSRKFTVKDGETDLTETVDWNYATNWNKAVKNAGDSAAFIIIDGAGNYVSSQPIIVPFTIYRKQITPTIEVANGPKTYDGTVGLDTVVSSGTYLRAKFNGLFGTSPITDEADFKNTAAYTVSDVRYGTANATQNTEVTAKITLKTGSSALARNYRFAAGSGDTATVRLLGEAINVRTPAGLSTYPTGSTPTYTAGDTASFAFSIPTLMAKKDKVYYNGYPRGIGAVNYHANMTNPGANPLTVLYKYPATVSGGSITKPAYFDSTLRMDAAFDTTIQPRDAGTYMVSVRVSGDGVNIKNGTYELGIFEIYPAQAPTFATNGNLSTSTITTKLNQSKQLTVVAESPNGGILQYQWYSCATQSCAAANDTTAIPNATSASYTAPANEQPKNFYYRVKVTNHFAGSGSGLVQVDASIMSNVATVSVNGIAKTLTKANTIVSIDNTKPWTYTGYQIKPAGTAVKVRFVKGPEPTDTVQLNEGTDYTLGYGTNVDVATGGSVRVEGVPGSDYEGLVEERFAIAKKEAGRGDLTYQLSRAYTGDTLNAGVKPFEPKTGLGAISVRYDDKDSVPVNAGEYVLEAKAAGGANYLASTDWFFAGMFKVAKRVPDTVMVKATIPAGHKEGVAGTKFGIDTNTIKIKGTGYGKVTVLYNDASNVPTTAGSYVVKISLEGGQNYEAGAVTIGTYSIGSTAVAEANREVPKTAPTEVVTVAPVKVAATGFTAGPSPVSKGGVIKFFSTKVVKSGSLYIFDASGNAVAKIAAKPGVGEIGSWNLKDKKGASVSEGTYVVKGVLIGKDGAKEKASFVFSVVQ